MADEPIRWCVRAVATETRLEFWDFEAPLGIDPDDAPFQDLLVAERERRGWEPFHKEGLDDEFTQIDVHPCDPEDVMRLPPEARKKYLRHIEAGRRIGGRTYDERWDPVSRHHDHWMLIRRRDRRG